MGLDIGQALREGASRTAAKNGLILAGLFASIALLTTVLVQTLIVGFFEILIEFLQEIPPSDLEEAGLNEDDYQELVDNSESTFDEIQEMSPLALGLPVGITAGLLLTVAIITEAVSIIAVRVFATHQTEAVTSDTVSENIVIATLNGFVGKITVWGFIILPLVPAIIIGTATNALVLVSLFILGAVPSVIFAVLFYFLRQEIAIKNKNFVQALADSWRITKGNRIKVFLIGALIVIVSRLEEVTGFIAGIASTTAGVIITAAVGGLLAAFGAAVVTRAYVQIDDDSEAVETEPEVEKDPYDAALGPDDLSR